MTNVNEGTHHGGDSQGAHGEDHGEHAPPNVLTSTTDPSTRYLYEAGRVLVTDADLGLAWKHLSLEGAEEIERDERLGLRVFETPRRDAVPELVDQSAGRVQPLHILTLGWHIGCPKDPTPCPPDAVPGLQGLVPSIAQPDGVSVGLIDTGVAHHPWLDNRIVAHHDNHEVPEKDDKGAVRHGFGHGTFAAGQIARQAPNCKIVALRRVLRDGTIHDLALARALLELGDGPEKVSVISLSMGGYTRIGTGLPATEVALRELFQQNQDLVVVAAAGNHGFGRRSDPAAFKAVVAVGAVDRQGRPAYFTNFGDSWVDACAVGVDIEGAFPMEEEITFPHTSDKRSFKDGFAFWSGTSFTAPFVAGAIAARINDGATGRDAVRDVISKPAKEKHVPGLGTRVD